MNFWENLPKPFFALAPMEDVTDVVFRQVVARAAKPDVFFTEFMNVSGFCHPMGRNSVARRLETSETDAPIIAQIWGKDPEQFAQTAAEIAQMDKFAGIDINMGCPVKDVVKTGGGSALIQNPTLAVELIQAVKEGSKNGVETNFSKDPSVAKTSFTGQQAEPSRSETNLSVSSGIYVLSSEGVESLEKSIPTPALPVSVKTRLGFSSLDEWRPWLTTLLKQNLSNLTVHLRTRKEMSKVPAHFEMIPEIVKLRDQIAPQTKLTINGDIHDRAHGMEIWRENPGLDGFMIGRGVFANPFCFERTAREHGKDELLDLLKYHLNLFDKCNNASFAGLSGESSNNSFKLDSPNKSANDEVGSFVSNRTIHKFDPLKRFFKIYVRDFDGASELRAKLMETKSTDEVRQILSEFNS